MTTTNASTWCNRIEALPLYDGLMDSAKSWTAKSWTAAIVPRAAGSASLCPGETSVMGSGGGVLAAPCLYSGLYVLCWFVRCAPGVISPRRGTDQSKARYHPRR